jgi:hypothetical protein
MTALYWKGLIMIRKMANSHVIASQAMYAARITTQSTGDDYINEVLHQLERLNYGLAEWEMDQIRREITCRLAMASL